MAAGVGSWSTTASENDDADSNINWLEGQAPSTVNGSARAEMAAHATHLRDGGFVSLTQYPFTYASGTTGTIATDVTANNLYSVGRRVRVAGSSTGTIYGRISASSYSAPDTTLTFVFDSGSMSNESLTLSIATLSPKAFAVGQFPGTSTSDAAVSGSVGEYVSSTVESASAINLTTATPANLTSIPLTAGDWDVCVAASFGGQSATAIQGLAAHVSLVSATVDTTPGRRGSYIYVGSSVLPSNPVVNVGPTRLSLAATTSVYAVVSQSFSGGTCSTFGIIHARRVR